MSRTTLITCDMCRKSNTVVEDALHNKTHYPVIVRSAFAPDREINIDLCSSCWRLYIDADDELAEHDDAEQTVRILSTKERIIHLMAFLEKMDETHGREGTVLTRDIREAKRQLRRIKEDVT